MKKTDLLNKLSFISSDLNELTSLIDGDEEIEEDFENEKIEELKEEIEELEDKVSELEQTIRDQNSIISKQEEENSELLEEIEEYTSGKKITTELVIEWFQSPFISDYDKNRVLQTLKTLQI